MAKQVTTVMLPIDDLTDDVAIGHLLEMRGLIPHDEILADKIENEMSRSYLRMAESFAAGYKLGMKGR